MVTITLYERQQKRHRCIEQSLDSVGEEEGGMICENDIETCIMAYKKLITSPGLMHGIECLGLVHWDNPEGWYGEGWKDVGLGFRMGNTCTPVADSC